MAETPQDRSSDEIRRDIEGTRAEMHETVDALERKISPGQLIDRVWGWLRGGGAESTLSSAGSVAREHPVPLSLMGLGVAWLAVERATGSGEYRSSRRGSVGPGTRARVGPYEGDEVLGEERSAPGEAKETAESAVEKAKSKGSAAARSARTTTAEAGRKASSAASRMSESASETAEEWQSRAVEQARRRGRQMKRGLRSTMEEQPLAVGAVAFGLGLAGGIAAPRTRLEDRTMGGAADAVKEEAKDVAESGREVVKETARAAGRQAERQGAGALEESAQRVAEEAKETARKRAREEDVDPEGMKKRASRTKDRAGEETPE